MKLIFVALCLLLPGCAGIAIPLGDSGRAIRVGISLRLIDAQLPSGELGANDALFPPSNK